MSRFGSDPRAFFDDVYRAPAPWDIGAAQPDLLRLIEEFPPSAPERGWRLLACRPAAFLSRVATVPAIVACVERRRLQRGV